MSNTHRLNRMLELLAADGHVSVDEAAAALGVSAATVRRDLDALAEQQLLTRTHGGAVSNGTAYDLPLRYKAARSAQEKVRIAAAAADQVPRGAVVGLNGGTTTTEVARALAGRAATPVGDQDSAITVVTNALNIANELIVRSQVKLVVLGGVPRRQSYELVGPLAIPVLDQLTLDVAILGVDGLDIENGATAHNEAEAEVNGRIAACAKRVMIVADSSKLGRAAFARIVSIDRVATVVTDDAAPDDIVAAMRSAGVEVLLA